MNWVKFSAFHIHWKARMETSMIFSLSSFWVSYVQLKHTLPVSFISFPGGECMF